MEDIIRGQLYSKSSFGEVYHRIYVRKFSFTVTLECDFGTYIGRCTSPNENFEYTLLQFELKLECCNPHKAARHPTKCDVIYDVKLVILSQIFDVIQSDLTLQTHV